MDFIHLTALTCLLIPGVSQGKPIILLQPSGSKMCEKLSRTVRFRYPVKFHKNDLTCQIDDDTNRLSLKPIVFQHANSSANSTNTPRRPLLLIDTRNKGKQLVPYGKKTMKSNQRSSTTANTATAASNTKRPLPKMLEDVLYLFASNCSSNISSVLPKVRLNYWGAILYKLNGSGALGANCTQDRECGDVETVGCYVGRCQCRPATSFSPTMKSCISCKIYGDTYSKYDGLGILRHNCNRIESVVNADVCWEYCLKVSFFCKSVEYQSAGDEKGLCLLSNRCYSDVAMDLRTSGGKGWMFLQRDCQ